MTPAEQPDDQRITPPPGMTYGDLYLTEDGDIRVQWFETFKQWSVNHCGPRLVAVYFVRADEGYFPRTWLWNNSRPDFATDALAASILGISLDRSKSW